MTRSNCSMYRPLLSRAQRFLGAALVASVVFLTTGSFAAEADRIATGDSADEVISKLGSRPDRIETSRLLGVSYQFMTFRKAGSLITVRLLFNRVIDVETRPLSIFGTLD